MKNKILYGLLGVAILAGLTFSIIFGLKPRPVIKIKLSKFETPDKLATAVQTIMFPEISSSKIFAFGYQPEEPDQMFVIKHWYKSGLADVWLADENLPLDEDFKNIERINTYKDKEQISNRVFEYFQLNKKVGLILPSVYSSQMIPGNFVDFFKRDKKIPITSISLVELIRKRDDEKLARIPCLVPDTDQTGMGPLGCAILQQSRMLYKKKLEPGKKVGYVDQRGVFDFLVFYSNQVEQAPVSKD